MVNNMWRVGLYREKGLWNPAYARTLKKETRKPVDVWRDSINLERP